MMRPSILSPQGLERLTALTHRRTLYAFDFDGTLAPLQDNPDSVRVDAELAACLARLASLAPVAIITGRKVDDVRPRLGFEPLAILGNHGAEDPGDRLTATRWSDALMPVRVRLSALSGELARAGVSIEDKGLSIALHHRLAHDPVASRRAIDHALEKLPSRVLRLSGKGVVNIVVADAPDKVAALRSLLNQTACATAFFAGDDSNDEPVFVAAAEDWVTLKIGEDVGSAARFGLANQDGMRAVVKHLVQNLFPAPLLGRDER